MQTWLGYESGTPVSAAATVANDGCLFLALVATTPTAQRKGYGDATVRQALSEGVRATGLTRTVLHASDAGFPVSASATARCARSRLIGWQPDISRTLVGSGRRCATQAPAMRRCRCGRCSPPCRCARRESRLLRGAAGRLGRFLFRPAMRASPAVPGPPACVRGAPATLRWRW
jgi:hypothetical protein